MTRLLIKLICWLSLGCLIIMLLAIGVGHLINPADNELIFTAYLKTRNNNLLYNIYRMDIAHGLIHRLPTNEDSGGDIDVSPDGQQIVFVRNFDQASAIYVMDFYGKNVHRVTSLGTLEYNPTWSPDGHSIVFIIAPTPSTPDLYIENLGSDSFHRLTDNNGNEHAPTWSPDSQHIVFASDMTTPNNMDIFDLDVNTREIHPLIATPVNDTDPVWSPNGRYLMYFVDDTKDPRLRLMLYDTLNDRTISLFMDNFILGDTPDWSPDGHFIVYSAITSFYNTSLFRLDVLACLQQPKTCSAQQLTNASNTFVNPRWRPVSP